MNYAKGVLINAKIEHLALRSSECKIFEAATAGTCQYAEGHFLIGSVTKLAILARTTALLKCRDTLLILKIDLLVIGGN